MKKEWKIAPKQSAEFVARMEDVLSVYLRAYDAKRPVVCVDESSKQQIQDVIESLPMKPGESIKFDSEYKRNGVSNLFMIFEPLRGWRHVKVTDRRTAIDFAHCLEELVDVHYPEADKIVLARLCSFYLPNSCCLKHPLDYSLGPFRHFGRDIFPGRGVFCLPWN